MVLTVYYNDSYVYVFFLPTDQTNTTLSGIYQLSLVKKHRGSRSVVSDPQYFTPLALTMPNNAIQFNYVIFRGNYRVQFRLCHFKRNEDEVEETGSFRECHNHTDSKGIKVSKNYPLKPWCSNFNETQQEKEEVSSEIESGKRSLKLRFQYTPCTDELFSYEGGSVSIYSSFVNSSSNDCTQLRSDILKGGKHSHINLKLINQLEKKAKLTADNSAEISYLVSSFFRCTRKKLQRFSSKINF